MFFIEESKKPYRITASSAIDQSFYNTATGRVLLANMTPEERRDFRQRVPIDFKKIYAPCDSMEITEIIKNIQTKAYEYIIKGEVTVIGVPLVNKSSGLNASIGIYFHTNGKTQAEIDEIVQEMQKTSAEISQILKTH